MSFRVCGGWHSENRISLVQILLLRIGIDWNDIERTRNGQRTDQERTWTGSGLELDKNNKRIIKEKRKMHCTDISRKYIVSDHNQSIGARSEDLVQEADLSAVHPRHHLHHLQHSHVLRPFPQRVLQTSGGGGTNQIQGP